MNMIIKFCPIKAEYFLISLATIGFSRRIQLRRSERAVSSHGDGAVLQLKGWVEANGTSF
jgi:hypothetical protein